MNGPGRVPRFPSLRMSWYDLLFAHWRVDPATLQALLPQTDPPLELDLWNGEAWIGIVPFRMANVGLNGLPGLPGARTFPELNVRTYVTGGGRPGVWFFSLDAASWLAVRGARIGFHLPYFDARMRCEPRDDGFRYQSRRTHRGGGTAVLDVDYRPTGGVFRSRPGRLEHWLTERYRLFSADSRGRLYRGEIEHQPWPLQPAAAEFKTSNMTGELGLVLPGEAPHLLFARQVDVRAARLVRA